MLKKALGFIETYGYVGAIEAADSCLKAANVKLMNCQFAGKGLVTIIVEGDVGSVKASIDAGAAAAERVGQVVGINVIARPGEGLEKVVEENAEIPEAEQISDGSVQNHEDDLPQKSVDTSKESTSELVDATTIDSIAEKVQQPINKEPFVIHEGKQIPFTNIEIFQTMKVVELRKIARQIEGISIKKDKIKYAKKDELLEAIKKAIEEVD